MASRRDPFRFDHGAQYFTARDPRFRDAVDTWIADGVAGEWRPRLGVVDGKVVEAKASTTTRYVGVPRMSAITRHLATGLDLHAQTRVASLEGSAGRWLLGSDAGASLGTFDTVLLTLPPLQAAQLLDPVAPDLAEAARAVEMLPCWAVLAAFDDGLDLPYDALFVNDHSLSWVARDSSKPGRSGAECWILHASPEWSAARLEEDAGAIPPQLLGAFFDLFDLEHVAPRYATAHRWRFAMAKDPLDVGCLYDPGLRLGVGGDWCHGSRVEGAFLSGLALAERALGATASVAEG